jgi:DNA-binding NarL/FixJ family response regulator
MGEYLAKRLVDGILDFGALVSAMKQKIRVLVADDHPVVRKGLQSCLVRQESLKLVGEAADGEEALEKALALVPDVVLLDISMPRRDGLAVTAALRKDAPSIKVLILSMHSNKSTCFGSFRPEPMDMFPKEPLRKNCCTQLNRCTEEKPSSAPKLPKPPLTNW